MRSVVTVGDWVEHPDLGTARPTSGFGQVYVADRANRRIQVFDYDLNFDP